VIPLTPYQIFGHKLVMPPWLRHLSSCLGAALATSPNARNLMRLGQQHQNQYAYLACQYGVSSSDDTRSLQQLKQANFFVNKQFFQKIRESPIYVIRIQSMPASHLTLSLFASFLSIRK
jgi:hypothetical protein